MSTSEIEKLLEKYYEGETTIAEEQQLKSFFLSGSVPPHLVIHAGQFLYYEKNAKEESADPLFEEKFLKKTGELPVIVMHPNRTRYYYISGIAAGILLLIGVFLTFREDVITPSKQNNLATNPEAAFKQTQSILMLVSLNLNKGVDKMNYLGQFDKAIRKIQYLEQFDNASRKIQRISKFYQYETLIINPGPFEHRATKSNDQ